MSQARAKFTHDRQDEQSLDEARKKADREALVTMSERLVHQIPVLPVFTEMICEFHGIDPDQTLGNLASTIVSVSEHKGFYHYDEYIGKSQLPLMQKEELDVNKNIYFSYPALKLSNIYKLDIYLIPYLDIDAGFACSVYDKVEKNKTVFPHDIPKERAISWMTLYLKTIYR